jgi:hypothetical protein
MNQVFVTIEEVFSAILMQEIKSLDNYAKDFLIKTAIEWIRMLNSRLEKLNVDAKIFLHLSKTEKFGHGKLKDIWNYQKDEFLILAITEAITLLQSFLRTVAVS